ncbi:hypothetical protein AeMF1_018598 [Aphanomyces euteiches]|nr:hypothetical protein AeMF1_018598 [Aphanomyces euteiches]KAH9187516.1 hypothetical protein AeNC1_010504 [Aphanomyces euteiches]
MLLKLPIPVPIDFFQCPPMSALDIKKYRGIGVQAAQDLIDFTRLTNGPIDWVLHTHSKAVQMYTARHENIPIFCLLSEIEASFDDIIAIFLKTTTADLRQTNSAFFPNVLDKVRLANVTLPSDDRPNHCLGLNWLLLTTPLRGFIVKYRDFYYIEHQDECIIDGKRAWIKADSSLWRRRRREVIELQHNRPNGQLEGPVADILMTKQALMQYKGMGSTQRVVRSYQLSKLSFLSEDSLVPAHMRSKCTICLKKFGTFQRKTHCRRCGEVICRNKTCSDVWGLLISGIQVRVRICNPCASIHKTTSCLANTSSRVTSSSASRSTSDDRRVDYVAAIPYEGPWPNHAYPPPAVDYDESGNPYGWTSVAAEARPYRADYRDKKMRILLTL